MATDIERLIVTLEARTKEYERALLKAHGTTRGALRKIELDMARSAKRQEALWRRAGAGIQTAITRSFAPLAAIAAGSLGGRAIVEFSDSFTKIENALRVAGVAGDDLAVTMGNLFDIATKHGAPVEALGVLYGRLALVQKELSISSEDLLGFSDNVAASLRVSGKSAAEASGALLQLSQALGSGVVRAEEFNSILEGAPAIAQAVARGLTEAGGSVARLRTFIIDGQVSSEAFFKAFQLGSVETQRQALLAERTIGQSWENIKTSLTQAVGALDDATGASGFLAAELDKLATGAKGTADEIGFLIRAASQLAGVFDKLTTLSPPAAAGLGLEGLRASIAQWETLLEQAEARGETAAAENMRARIAELEAEIVKGMRSLVGPAFERGGRESAESFAAGFKTISIADALANDLGGALEGVLERQKKLFSGLSGGAGKGPVIDLEFKTTGAPEQLQAIIQQREAIADLTADLSKLETALSAHFDTSFDDIMGIGAAEGAREAFGQAIRDLEALSQAFIDGAVPAQVFDDRVAGIKERLESLAGTGNELDPFIDDMLKATSVAGQMQSQLEQARNAIKNLGSGFTTQAFKVPGGGSSGPIDVRITRPVDIDPDGFRPIATALDRGFGSFDQHGRTIAAETGRTADRLGGLDDSIYGSGERITGAIGQQTGALVSAFRSIPGVNDGPHGGSAGGSQALRFNINSQSQQRLDSLSAERNVLQASQFKQLSPEKQHQVDMRLAEIDLEAAKLNQKMVETSAAFSSLAPTINKMAQAGAAFSVIAQWVQRELGNMTGGSWGGGSILGFAGGGVLRGPGGPTGDKIPVMGSDEEFMVNARQSKKHRALLWAINEDRLGKMADGGLVSRVNAGAQRLANGGVVQASAAAVGSREVNAPINITVMAQDADSFRRSERDIGRRIAAEVEYHMRG